LGNDGVWNKAVALFYTGSDVTLIRKDLYESQFLKHVQNTIHQVDDGRVEVSLPWKHGFSSCLKFNRHQALSWLHSIKCRLSKAKLLETYSQEMDLIISEFAEPVPATELANKTGWYLDHFPVLNPKVHFLPNCLKFRCCL